MAKETNNEAAREALLKLNLNFVDWTKLLRGLVDHEYFNECTRPMLYTKCKDTEAVHDMVLHMLHKYGHLTPLLTPLFKPPENLMIKVNRVDISPFGTAAGMDKNGEAFAAFEHIFGFQEAGTVTVNSRPGNEGVRMASVNGNRDIINACGFPSKGLSNFLGNISRYRTRGGKAVIYASVCGLPLSGENGVQSAMEEMGVLVSSLNQYVDGFVWNPSCCNVKELELIRTEEVFYRTAKLMRELAPDKLRLVKIGHYNTKNHEEEYRAIRYVGVFMEGGGDGIVTINTKMLGKDQIPESARERWGYFSAGISGASLREDRLRSVWQMRDAFHNAVIVATGGIYTAQDVYDTICAGANMVEGFTPYAYFGPGLVRKIMAEFSDILARQGVSLRQLQEEVEDGAKFGRRHARLLRISQ